MSSFYDYRNSVRFVTSIEGSGSVAMDKIHSDVQCNASDPDNCRYHKTGRFAQGKSNAFEPGEFDVSEVQDYLADLMTAHGVDGEMDVTEGEGGHYQAHFELKNGKMRDGMERALEQFFKCKGVWTEENGRSIRQSLYPLSDKKFYLNFRMPNSPKAIAKTDKEDKNATGKKQDAAPKKAEKPVVKPVEKKAEKTSETVSEKPVKAEKKDAKAFEKHVAEKKETPDKPKEAEKKDAPKKVEKPAPKAKVEKKAADIPYENESDTDGDDDAVAPEPVTEVPVSKPKDDDGKGPSDAELAAIEAENDDDADGEIGSAAGEVNPNDVVNTPIKTPQGKNEEFKGDDDHLPDAFWEKMFGGKIDLEDLNGGDDDEEEEESEKAEEAPKAAEKTAAETSPKKTHKSGFLTPDKPKAESEMARADAQQQKADIAAAKASGENTEAKVNPNADTHTKASENGGIFVCKSFEPAIVGKFEAGFQDDQKKKMMASGVSSADYTVGVQQNMHERLDFDKAQKAFTDSAQAVAASIKQIKQLALNGGTMGFQLDRAYDLFNSRLATYNKAAQGMADAGKALTAKTQPLIARNGKPTINYPNALMTKLSITRSPLEKGSIFDKMRVSTIGGTSETPSKDNSGTAEGATAENQPVVPAPDAPTSENKVTLNSEATKVQNHPKSEEAKPTVLAKVAKSTETDTAENVLKTMKGKAKSAEVAAYYDKAMTKLGGLIG